tara:strand:- start:6477 stop:6680 length:204 start_codon:yes stop_codon:yes gene_type:complete
LPLQKFIGQFIFDAFFYLCINLMHLLAGVPKYQYKLPLLLFFKQTNNQTILAERARNCWGSWAMLER